MCTGYLVDSYSLYFIPGCWKAIVPSVSIAILRHRDGSFLNGGIPFVRVESSRVEEGYVSPFGDWIRSGQPGKNGATLRYRHHLPSPSIWDKSARPCAYVVG